MPKAKYVLTGPASSPLARALGRSTESISVYSDAELKRRQEAARKAGVKVTVRPAPETDN